jgi:hypothetical protein
MPTASYIFSRVEPTNSRSLRPNGPPINARSRRIDCNSIQRLSRPITAQIDRRSSRDLSFDLGYMIHCQWALKWGQSSRLSRRNLLLSSPAILEARSDCLLIDTKTLDGIGYASSPHRNPTEHNYQNGSGSCHAICDAVSSSSLGKDKQNSQAKPSEGEKYSFDVFTKHPLIHHAFKRSSTI